ncbi:MAG TPA: Yip1 family protein [Bacteroidales bacterium]|nr:Yip1 family protein [Bacteroidales bacterium]HRZ48618.1 Yip1 family protein [Bacteroidales bacterium]
MKSSISQWLHDATAFLKKMVLRPGEFWNEVADHPGDDTMHLTFRYLMPLAAVPAVAHLIGWGIVGRTYRTWGMVTTVRDWSKAFSNGFSTFLAAVITVWVTAFLADRLAGSFRSERNFIQSFRLIVYAMTPVLLGGIFNLIPSIAMIGSVVALFSVVLLYTGIPLMKRTHEESRTSYLLVVLVLLLVCYNVSHLVLKGLFDLIFSVHSVASV